MGLFLYAIGKVFGRRDRRPPPLILPIPRPSIEQLENDLCAVRRRCREKTRAASEAFAIAANLRHKLDQAQASLATATEQLERSERALVIAEERRKRLADECRERSEALAKLTANLTAGVEAIKADRLRLQPWPFEPGFAVMVAGTVRMSFFITDAGGEPAIVTVCGATRKLMARIIDELLPLAGNRNADGPENAEKKS